MTRFWGADTEQVTAFAERAESSAEVLVERAAALAALLAQVDWQGRDAEDFRSHWSGTVQPGIEQCADALRRRGTELRQHAEAQESTSDPASEAGGGGGAGSGGGSTGGGGNGGGTGGGSSGPEMVHSAQTSRPGEWDQGVISATSRDMIARDASYIVGYTPGFTRDFDLIVCDSYETLQRGHEIGDPTDVLVPTPRVPLPVPDVRIPTPVTPTIPFTPVPDVRIPTPPTIDVKIDDIQA
jgi:uncharacterized protein YukE